RGTGGGEGVVRGCDQPDAPAGGLPLHPGHHEPGAADHREDHLREPGEESLPRGLVTHRLELLEGGPGAERAAAFAPEDDHPRGRIAAGRVDRLRESGEQRARERIALRVSEGDGRDALAHLGVYGAGVEQWRGWVGLAHGRRSLSRRGSEYILQYT